MYVIYKGLFLEWADYCYVFPFLKETWVQRNKNCSQNKGIKKNGGEYRKAELHGNKTKIYIQILEILKRASGILAEMEKRNLPSYLLNQQIGI